MKITRYQDAALFDDCCETWCELLADSDANQIFLTCEWQATWWDTYQPGDLWILVIEDEETGQWQGVAPWFIQETDDGRRVVRTVGCVDVTDYLDVIARRGVEDAVFHALLGWLAEHDDEFDEVLMCNVPGRSKALERIPALGPEHGLQVETSVQDVCPVVTLPDEFNEYIAGLDKKNRHELRRKIRRAAGSSAWYIVGPEHDLDAEIAKFLDLMAASAEEKAKFLQDENNRRFFERIVPKVAARGWLQLAFLTVAGDPAAGYVNFVYNDRVLVYNSGHAAGEHGHLSPGIVLLGRLIEHAIEQGYAEFDFLRGDEPYKYDMGGRDTEVHQLRITPESEGRA